MQNSIKDKMPLVILLLILQIALFFINVFTNYEHLYICMLMLSLQLCLLFLGMTFGDSKRSALIFAVLCLGCVIAFLCFAKEWYFFLYLLPLLMLINYANERIKRFCAVAGPVAMYLLFYACGVYTYNAGSVVVNCIIMLAICFSFVGFDMLIEKYIVFKSRMYIALKNSCIDELNEKELNKQLVIKNYLVDKKARMEERERISLDIHNSVGHTVTSAIVALDAGSILIDIDKNKAVEKITTARTRMSDSLESIRRAVRVLDDMDGEISISDLCKILIVGIQRFTMDTDIKIRHNLNSESDINITKEDCEFLNGMVLECLTNGVKHGKATLFTIVFQFDEKHMMLCVENNGNSYSGDINSALKSGFGIKKMREYAEKKGGNLSIDNANGFTTRVTLPIIEKLK